MLKPRTKIGRYHVLHALGRAQPDGLFAATDEEGRRFAMRTPIGDLEHSGSAVTDRMLPDATALKEVTHLNIVPLFTVFVTFEGYLCLVTELVSGRNLRFTIDHGTLGPVDAMLIARQLLDSAAAAHRAGIVHQSLDPTRVLLVRLDGWDLVKVADWGLQTLRLDATAAFGKDALTGVVRKVPAAYMAPEQVLDRGVDGRTDLYAIGTILFEMLAGRPPFQDSDPFNVMSMHVSQDPPPLRHVARGKAWVTQEIEDLMARALAKAREERFHSASEMIGAWEAAFRSIAHLQRK